MGKQGTRRNGEKLHGDRDREKLKQADQRLGETRQSKEGLKKTDNWTGRDEKQIRRKPGEKKGHAKGGRLSFPTRLGLVFRGEVRLETQQELLNTEELILSRIPSPFPRSRNGTPKTISISPLPPGVRAPSLQLPQGFLTHPGLGVWLSPLPIAHRDGLPPGPPAWSPGERVRGDPAQGPAPLRLAPGNPALSDAATCRPDLGSTTRLRAGRAGGSESSPCRPGPRPRGIFLGIRVGLLARAPARLALRTQLCGFRD